MPTYQPYYPDQAELLPAHVKDVLGPDHLCFVVHEVVEACDLSAFEKQDRRGCGRATTLRSANDAKDLAVRI
jgi:hypothetical protein